LSEEVLREAAGCGILPHAMILELCLANPDGTRNQSFIDFLGGEISNPLPQYMLDIIVANWNEETARSFIEADLAKFTGLMFYYSNKLIDNYKFDTIDQTEGIQYWLKRRNFITDQYELAESFIELNEFDSVRMVLDTIDARYDLKEIDLTEFEYFEDYVNFRESIYDDERNYMQLDSLEIIELQNMAEGSNTRASLMAQNILCFGYGICYEAEPEQTSTNPLYPKNFMIGDNYGKIIQDSYNKVEVYPNPGNVLIAFNWYFPLLKDDAILSISNGEGKLMLKQKINSIQGQWIWDTRNVDEGVYFYDIKDSKQRLGQGKIVVSR